MLAHPPPEALQVTKHLGLRAETQNGSKHLAPLGVTDHNQKHMCRLEEKGMSPSAQTTEWDFRSGGGRSSSGNNRSYGNGTGGGFLQS